MNDPMDHPDKVICGALNRQGKPCQKPPMRGKKRCLAHGGKTPSGKHSGKSNGNHKHGLYSNALTEAEAAAWDSIPLGDVDAEIKMLKIKLARAFALENEINQDPNSAKHTVGFQLSEIRRSTGDHGTNTDAISRRPDTAHIMNWVTGRIAQLEKIRLETIAAAKASGDGVNDIAQDLIEAMRAITKLEADE
jgi:hypothetical protein